MNDFADLFGALSNGLAGHISVNQVRRIAREAVAGAEASADVARGDLRVLKAENERLKLYMAALVRLLARKGVFSTDEFLRLTQGMVGVVDGRLEGPIVPGEPPLPEPRIRGWIQALLPSQIFVPRPHNRVLKPFQSHDLSGHEEGERDPRFAVNVTWGARHEPWITAVRLLDAETPTAP